MTVDGLLLVDKPVGWTSHDAVSFMRKLIGEKRIGHTGTLDPGATGLLILLIGKASRLARYFEADDKEYQAAMRLGAETDTQDMEGKIVRECPVPELDPEDVLRVFGRFTGEIEQEPPMFSAIKHEGKPLYKMARAGQEVERKLRRIKINALELTGMDGPSISFRVACSKGTYVRTLCRDMGIALGSCAHMESLIRTRAGSYSLDNALKLETRPSREDAIGKVVPLKAMLQEVPSAVVTPLAAAGIKNGVSPSDGGFEANSDHDMHEGPIRLMDESGELLAMGETDGKSVSLRVVLV
ncbi:MAG: tRNA pseudouridine(55) synthase TruB [Nitrospirota bacterium]